MKRIHVLVDFLKYSVVRKIEFGRNVVTKLTGNASFTSPDLTLAQATTLNNNLEAAVIAADGGNKTQKAAAVQAEKLWDEGFRMMALYVERIALGNDVMILSAGFNTSHQPVSRINPDFSVERGKLSGEVKLKHKRLSVKSSWIWQMCDKINASEEDWKTVGTTLQSRFVISGLKPLTKYWFRAAAVTSKGQQDWCEPHSVVVL